MNSRSQKTCLRVCHADTDDIDNPLRGGQPVRTYEINSRLAARHDITVFTAVYEGCKRRRTIGRLNYRRLGFRLRPFGLSPHLTFLAALGPTLARTPHDLVVEEFMAPIGFCLLPWWTSKPVISIVQWYFFESWERRYHLPFSKWMRCVARTKRYRYFIVQTESMRRKIEQLIPGALIRRIPPGLERGALLPANTASGDGFALFLGRLDTQHKGLDLLCEAWAKICAPAGIPLVIAGEGAARAELEEIIARNGLGSCIRLVGRAEGEAKAGLLRDCRIVVMPSRFETFGLVAAEAMAARKPVVAFDIENLNEVVSEPWGTLVEKFDAEAFGRAVLDLWRNRARCHEMGELAQREAKNYLWDNLAEAQNQFYQEVAETHRE